MSQESPGFSRGECQVSGHTCDGRCESGYGWNVYADWIDILDPKPEREYEPVSADEIRVLLGGCAV